jgi:hypothetical protein
MAGPPGLDRSFAYPACAGATFDREEELEGRRLVVLTGGANASQDPAESLCLVLLNHGQHSSQPVRFEQGPGGEAGLPQDSSPSPYETCWQPSRTLFGTRNCARSRLTAARISIDCWLVGGSSLQESVELAGNGALAAAADLALLLPWAKRRLV